MGPESVKYMGSKRAMLTNGLGEVLSSELPRASRFVDLFTGSGTVAWYAATHCDIEVLATDLQRFAVSLAASVVCREVVVESDRTLKEWMRRARTRVTEHPTYNDAARVQDDLAKGSLKQLVTESRGVCADPACGPVQQAYGGFYFSPLQALWIDSLRATLPRTRSARIVAMAALIETGSRCAASPGHTAQPFQPNETAGPFLVGQWTRNAANTAWANYISIGSLVSRRAGDARVADAVKLAHELRETDLVFVDPPYSSVQYSRFYHVLEMIACGESQIVEGVGRYPPLTARPQSKFSLKSESESALRTLLEAISGSRARVVVTFPAGKASNGLSGRQVAEIAAEFFHIVRATVTGRFSTLGGNRVTRAARQESQELILTLSPK
jgi:adenine-specific DNA-methyltransferase